MFEKVFHLKENHTDVKTEILAGLTTFLAMAYVLAVNPDILGNVMDKSGVFAATAIASAIATFIMAFLANYPIALSAGMGLNAYFAYSVCLGDLKGMPNAFTVALTAVFCEGVIFLILSIFKAREQIINGIPQNLKYGITVGIGLFIALLGLEGSGIVVSDDSSLVSMGNPGSPQFVLCIVGFLIIIILEHFNVKGAVLIGILSAWVLGMIAQGTGWYVVDAANGAASVIPDFSNGLLQLSGLKNTAFHFNFVWAFTHIGQFLAILFSFLFVDLFDTVGCVVGIADKANLLDKDGKVPRVGRVLLSDAIGTTVGACLGTSTITSYAESSTGVSAGGRTGLTAFTTGVLFLASLALSPLFLAIPSFATAPALIYVGMIMLTGIRKINFSGDLADTVSAYMAIIIMPMTYSIANGIMFGVITWVIIKLFTKQARQVKPVMWVITGLFALRIFTLII